jgi:hypothetical protein
MPADFRVEFVSESRVRLDAQTEPLVINWKKDVEERLMEATTSSSWRSPGAGSTL